MPDIRWFINNGDYFYFGRGPKHISGVELDKHAIALTEVGQVEYLNVTLIPEDPVESVSLNWSSSDTSIATVVPSTKTLRLPSTYQEVEYIQTTGTQFINTGVSLTNSIQVETKIEVTTTTQNIPIFGNYLNNSTSYTSGNYYHLTPYSSKFYYGLNNSEGNAGTYSATVGTVYEIEYNNSGNSLVVNGSVLASVTNTTGYSSSVLAIARRGSNAGTQYYGQFKYFYFKVYDKTTSSYVRDFVPCYRKSDNVIGLYDLVNNQFYTNSGSGVFTKGDDHDTYIGGDAMVTCVTPGECSIVVTTNPRGYTDTCEVGAWELFDETNAAQSTTGSGGVIASPNGKFIRPSYSFGGGNGAYSIGTQDGYDVFIASGNHNNLDIGFSDTVFNSLISDYSKIKIIYDYFNVGSKPSSYTNQILFANNENVYANSGGIGKGSSFSSVGFALSTPYSMEQIINTSDMSTVTTVKNLNTQETWDIPSYTKSFWRETNSTYIINGGGNVLFHMTRDAYGGPVVMGNIHIYGAR